MASSGGVPANGNGVNGVNGVGVGGLTTPTGSKPSMWKKVSEKVESGEMLLHREQQQRQERWQIQEREQHESNGDDLATKWRLSIAKRRERVIETIQSNMDFTLRQCLIAIALYIAMSVVIFTYVLSDHYTVIDSMYFAMVTFTTIGYGDIVPNGTVTERFFTCFYALSGVACLGIALGVVGNNLIDAERSAVERTREIAGFHVFSLFSPSCDHRRGVRGGESDGDGEEGKNNGDDENDDGSSSDRSTGSNGGGDGAGAWRTILLECLMVMIVLLVFACLVAEDPGMVHDDDDEAGNSHKGAGFHLGNALYYTIITASTVGYGDYTPKTQWGKVYAVIFIPLAVGAMGHLLGIVADAIIEARQSSYRNKLLGRDRRLTMSDIEVMDDDGDGRVSKLDFVEFMLVAMNEVDKDLLRQLRDQFDSLDVDGTGVLSKNDLIQMARAKLRCPERKVQLAEYKRYLLEQAESSRQQRQAETEGRIGEIDADARDRGVVAGDGTGSPEGEPMPYNFRRPSVSLWDAVGTRKVRNFFQSPSRPTRGGNGGGDQGGLFASTTTSDPLLPDERTNLIV